MTFDELFGLVTAPSGRFGHRDHVHLTWLAIGGVGPVAAVALVSDGIQRLAASKYHATMTRGWVELIAARMAVEDSSFDDFVLRCPEVLDKGLLHVLYKPETLASAAARTGWVPPDR